MVDKPFVTVETKIEAVEVIREVPLPSTQVQAVEVVREVPLVETRIETV